jgi:hypothetical protein
LSDDAPQFKLLTYEQALCWIHDGRNYKKLRPVMPMHRENNDAELGASAYEYIYDRDYDVERVWAWYGFLDISRSAVEY